MGVVVAGAGISFGLALVLLAAFFRTQIQLLDRLAEWCFVLFGILGVVGIVGVRDWMGDGMAGVAGTALTAVGVAGAAVMGLAELGSVLRLVDFRRIAGLTTVAFLLFLLWVAGVSAVALTTAPTPMPTSLAWLGVISIASGVAIVAWIVRTPGVITGDAEPGSTAMTVFFLPMVGIVAWMLWLSSLVG